MTLFGREINVAINTYYVAEVVGTQQYRVTRNFDTIEEAKAAKRRMPIGHYAILEQTKTI